MDSQRTVNWCIYDTFYFGITRGFLQEAVNCTDLAEGIQWLVLSRIGTFHQVKRAWQCITHSGKKPHLVQKACPLCGEALKLGQEDLAHLVVTCEALNVTFWTIYMPIIHRLIQTALFLYLNPFTRH